MVSGMVLYLWCLRLFAVYIDDLTNQLNRVLYRFSLEKHYDGHVMYAGFQFC